MSKRPIVKEDKPLKLTGEQIDQLVSRGLSVSLAYRDGARKKIKKGRLVMAGGCECCGEWIEFVQIYQPNPWNEPKIKTRIVHFPNAYSLGLFGSRR